MIVIERCIEQNAHVASYACGGEEWRWGEYYGGGQGKKKVQIAEHGFGDGATVGLGNGDGYSYGSDYCSEYLLKEYKCHR